MSTETLAPSAHASACHSLTTHEHIGFELGWDYAHHRLSPAAPYAQEPSPLRHGMLAGQAAFGSRTLEPTGPVRRWLQLRLHAWLRGRSVELFQVTPHYLHQLEVSHCPITRVPLATATTTPDTGDASVDRVRNDAGYAAGNLAMMSAKANQAKAAHGFADALQFVKQIEAGKLGGIHGLTASQWSRLAVLCSFVEPLPHEQACAVPLLLLPPNRLHLFNPAQALQAFVSRQLLQPGWSHRVSRFEALLPGKPARRAFRDFFHALLPRVLESAPRPTTYVVRPPRGGETLGAARRLFLTAGRTAEPQRARWAIEDAWRNPLVLKRWTAFARLLSAEQCEGLIVRAAARKLATVRTQQLGNAQATEGWNLESRGYVPHALLMQRGPGGVPRDLGRTVPAPVQIRLPL